MSTSYIRCIGSTGTDSPRLVPMVASDLEDFTDGYKPDSVAAPACLMRYTYK